MIIVLVTVTFVSLTNLCVTILANEYYNNLNQPHNPNQSYPEHHHHSIAVESRDSYQSPSYGWPSHHHQDNHHQDHHHHHHSNHAPAGWGWGNNNNEHGHDFRSYFDIALTALAFLSFGVFLLNLLLNALLYAGLLTSTGGTGGTYITYPTGTNTGGTGTNTGGITYVTTTGGGGTNTGGGGITYITTTGTGVTGTGGVTGVGRKLPKSGDDDEGRGRKRRPKRAALELYLDPVTSMDSLALSVLQSIDAMVGRHECVGKAFCEGNRQAQIIGSGFQYLMPLCSMSASYIGTKFGWHLESMLEHLTAVLLGVGETNCQLHFPHC